MKRLKMAMGLFVQFFIFGCTTFGGGWSIVAQIQRTYVEKRGWLTEKELVDLASIARGIPGITIGNTAMIFGYRSCGVLGGICCLFGMVLPPFLIICAIAFFYQLFMENTWIMNGMKGIRAAVVPIILVSCTTMARSAIANKWCAILCVIAFGLYMIFNISGIVLIIFGALGGLVISSLNKKEEEKP